MRLMACDHIKLAGVQENSAKRIATSLSHELTDDPKLLSKVTELLQTNESGKRAVALMLQAMLDCPQRGPTPAEPEQKRIYSLRKPSKDVSCNVIRSMLNLKLKTGSKNFKLDFVMQV